MYALYSALVTWQTILKVNRLYILDIWKNIYPNGSIIYRIEIVIDSTSTYTHFFLSLADVQNKELGYLNHLSTTSLLISQILNSLPVFSHLIDISVFRKKELELCHKNLTISKMTHLKQYIKWQYSCCSSPFFDDKFYI